MLGPQSSLFLRLRALAMGRQAAPRPSPCELNEGNFFSTLLHRHLTTDSVTTPLTYAGEDSRRLTLTPRSLHMQVADKITHPNLLSVATTAAAGPYTTDQAFFALGSQPCASSSETCNNLSGSQCSHTAMDQKWMTPTWASKAGSAAPTVLSSASIKDRSRSAPQPLTRNAHFVCAACCRRRHQP